MKNLSVFISLLGMIVIAAAVPSLPRHKKTQHKVVKKVTPKEKVILEDGENYGMTPTQAKAYWKKYFATHPQAKKPKGS